MGHKNKRSLFQQAYDRLQGIESGFSLITAAGSEEQR